MTTPDPSRITWRKSHRSNNGGNCVEVAQITDTVAIRDSKAPDAGHVTLSRQAWATFINGARAGRYDR